MNKSGLVLKKGRDKAVRQRHHWIFSGAIEHYPEGKQGEIYPVYSSNQELLGYATLNRGASIAARMLSFGAEDPLESLRKNIFQAIAWRKKLFSEEQTTAYRLINGEGDQLPGLVVDRYDQVLVVQIATLGVEKLKNQIVETLVSALQPQTIFEKSTQPARKEEGLQPVQQLLYGASPDLVTIQENGLNFIVDIPNGQKTGFFCDHRKMREQVRHWSKGAHVLNTFAYTGGFSAYAAAGGAKFVHSVDISAPAIALAEKNVAANALKSCQLKFTIGDVFSFLREERLDQYDLMILDPPAFAKRKQEVVAACRGYKEINRLVIQQAKPGTLLLTCSCSYHVDTALFQTVVFQAALEAGRSVRIVGRHQMAPDHPINLFHPEGDYLKSLWLQID